MEQTSPHVTFCFTFFLIFHVSPSSGSVREQPEFYYSNGDYYVADNNFKEGCVIVPGGNSGSRESDETSGGQCVKLYAGVSCNGHPLVAPAGLPPSFVYDEVSSYHLCSWEPPVQNQTLDRSVTPLYKLYDYKSYSCSLVRYRDVRECQNLPESADDQVSSIKNYGNCLYLFDGRNCEGEMLKVDGKSFYHWDLKRHNFSDKASSIRGCDEGPSSCTNNSIPSIYRFYEDNVNQDLLIEYNNKITECTNLPNFADDQISSVKILKGNCVRLHEHTNCKGWVLEINPSFSNFAKDLKRYAFNNKMSSISGCGDDSSVPRDVPIEQLNTVTKCKHYEA